MHKSSKMGIKGLWTILSPFFSKFQFDKPLQSRTVAVDAFTVMYAYGNAYSTDNFHIAAIYRISIKLMRNGFIPVFIFDNQSSFLKRQTQNERKAKTNFKDIEIQDNNDVLAYQFSFKKKESTFKTKIQNLSNEIDELFTQEQLSETTQPYVPESFYQYAQSHKQLKLTNSNYRQLLQELDDFSNSQLEKIKNQHKGRSLVDFSTQKHQLSFLNQDTFQDEYNMDNYAFKPKINTNNQQIRQIGLKYLAEKESEEGDKLNEILKNLKIAQPRDTLERTIQHINFSDFDFEPVQKSTFYSQKTNLELVNNNELHMKLTTKKLNEVKYFLQLCSIPHFTAAKFLEADQVCAIFTREKICQFAFSVDSDLLVFGAENLIQFRDEEMQIISKNILQQYKLKQINLIFVSIILGSDFSAGVDFFGPVGAIEILAECERMDNLSDLRGNLDEFARFLISGNGKFTKFGQIRAKMIKEGKNMQKLAEQVGNEEIIQLFLNQTKSEESVEIEFGVENQVVNQFKQLKKLNKKFLLFLAGNFEANTELNSILSDFKVSRDERILYDVTRFVDWQVEQWQHLRASEKERKVEFKSARVEKAIQKLITRK